MLKRLEAIRDNARSYAANTSDRGMAQRLTEVVVAPLEELIADLKDAQRRAAEVRRHTYQIPGGELL